MMHEKKMAEDKGETEEGEESEAEDKGETKLYSGG